MSILSTRRTSFAIDGSAITGAPAEVNKPASILSFLPATRTSSSIIRSPSIPPFFDIQLTRIFICFLLQILHRKHLQVLGASALKFSPIRRYRLLNLPFLVLKSSLISSLATPCRARCFEIGSPPMDEHVRVTERHERHGDHPPARRTLLWAYPGRAPRCPRGQASPKLPDSLSR